MSRARIDPDAGGQAVRTWAASRAETPRPALATAVRHTLGLLAERSPGTSVEVRVPPFGVVQCVPGPRHTRGTPPAVIETDPQTWLRLATGELDWGPALDSGALRASGERADLVHLLPLAELG